VGARLRTILRKTPSQPPQPAPQALLCCRLRHQRAASPALLPANKRLPASAGSAATSTTAALLRLLLLSSMLRTHVVVAALVPISAVAGQVVFADLQRKGVGVHGGARRRAEGVRWVGGGAMAALSASCAPLTTHSDRNQGPANAVIRPIAAAALQRGWLRPPGRTLPLKPRSGPT
jgi:hypothetical protein